MAIWLALCLPALPLQLAERALVAPAATAIAVVDGPAQRPQVLCCSDAARAAGVAPGQKLAEAQALCAELLPLQRDPGREREALLELACWAYQFSHQVVTFESALPGGAGGVLIETAGSQRLFAGRDALHRRIARELRSLGYRGASTGHAPTPRAARWIALARLAKLADLQPRDASSAAALPEALAPLPLRLLEWDAATTSALHALGLQTIGDLLRLPRAGFARRFDPRRLDELDQALGNRPDPQPAFTPPEHFAARLELPADLVDAAQLLPAAQRLLAALEGYLRGRGAGAAELAFTAHHNPRRAVPTPPTRIGLNLAAPERDAARLGQLLAERLTRVRLAEPAISLELEVERLLPFDAINGSLLPPAAGPDAGTERDDWLPLAETLHARLGSERVFQMHVVDDHRPEYAQRIATIALDPGGGSPAGAATSPPAQPRPLLMLRTPRALPCRDETPQYRGALALLAGPERIESGWWDLGDARRRAVHRDYFVARNPAGQTLWVYRELAAPRGWFLHGFFA